jgi:hypothetical protein
MSNGDAKSTPVPLLRDMSILDYTKAEEVLRSKFGTKDGLDVETLLNSSKNGALTYNDFLVLPGYIGTEPAFCTGLVHKTDQAQGLLHLRYRLIPRSQREFPSKPRSSPRPWTPLRNTQWQYTWRFWEV